METTTTWKFVNKTTGKEIECNDLNYLITRIREDKGLNLPDHVDVDMILWGRKEYVVEDEYGTKNDVVIGEHSPSRGIYFTMNQIVN